jgi:hypothetical protein
LGWFSKSVSKPEPTEEDIGEQLCDAAWVGEVDELRRLIEGGADVNATNRSVSVYVGMCSCETQEYDGSLDAVTNCA